MQKYKRETFYSTEGLDLLHQHVENCSGDQNRRRAFPGSATIAEAQ